MGSVWKTLRRQAAKHPTVLVPLLVGVVGLMLSLLLIAAHIALVGQLVAGLAVVPLSFAVYLRLLFADTRPDGNGGGGSSGEDGEPRPPRPEAPADGVDWERFEHDFWAYVDERVLVG